MTYFDFFPIDPPEHREKDEHTCPQCGNEWMDDDDSAACPGCEFEWPKDCDTCPDGPDDKCDTGCPNFKGGK